MRPPDAEGAAGEGGPDLSAYHEQLAPKGTRTLLVRERHAWRLCMARSHQSTYCPSCCRCAPWVECRHPEFTDILEVVA